MAQHVTQINLCVDVTAMSQIPAFVSRCHSTCMLFSGIVFAPVSIFWSLGFFETARSRAEEGFSPEFPPKELSGKSFCSCSVEASVFSYLSSWSVGGDLVTFDRFKTSAPPLISFPEPPSSLCFHPCSCSALCFVLFTGFSVPYSAN